MKYKILRCPNCSTLQMSSAKKNLKCIKCNKSKTLSYLKIYYSSENPNLCSKILQELKLEKSKNENKYSEEFESII